MDENQMIRRRAFIFGIIGLFTVMGIITPGFGWFLYLFLMPFWAIFPIVVIGTKGALICFIIYLVGYPAVKLYLKNSDWYRKTGEDLGIKGSALIGGFTFTSGGGFSGGGGFIRRGRRFRRMVEMNMHQKNRQESLILPGLLTFFFC